MSISSPWSAECIPGGVAGRLSRRARVADWLKGSRSHRVLCFLVGLWVINVFDLLLTVLAHRSGLLHEENPIAARILPLGPWMVCVYKTLLVVGASAILLTYRRRFIAECASLGMLVIYTLVAFQWKLCYEMYEISWTGAPTETTGIDAPAWLSVVGL